MTKILAAPTGCHAAGQGVLMYDGRIKPVEEVQLGNLLMGPDSKPRTVLNLICNAGEMYKVSPRKGKCFVVNKDHVLTLVRTRSKKSDCKSGEIVDVSLRDYLKWSKWKKHLYKLFFVSVDFPARQDILEIDPYFLGVILGDGICNSGSIGVSTSKPELITEVKRQAKKFGLGVRKSKRFATGNSITYWFVGEKSKRNSISSILRKLELRYSTAGTKFIPHEYKRGSRETRYKILAGLLDTDGHLNKGLNYDFISKSETLSRDVAFVARSLGFLATLTEKESHSQYGGGGIYYRVCISGRLNEIPCKIEYKKAKSEQRQIKDHTRTGFSVEYVENGDYYGFQLDDNGRYLLDDFVVTHNSGKTAYAAASSKVNASLLNGNSSPADFGLPSNHLAWRPNQVETLAWLTDCQAARTIALCRTKNLQVHQYAQEYNFDYLTGRSNWPCAHKLNPGATADECLYGMKMRACEHAPVCQYLQKKETVQSSDRASLNYAYFLTARWPRESLEDDPDAYLFLDECHELSETIISFVSVTVTKRNRREYSLPMFPKLRGKSANKLMAGTGMDVVGPALAWLNECLPIMERVVLATDQVIENERIACGEVSKESLLESKRANRLFSKIAHAKDAIDANRDDWYICSGPNARQAKDRSTGKMKSEPAFVARPLTAANYYRKFFEHGQQTVLMSATIGGIDEFTKELGLDKSEYEFRSVPNQFTSEQRPIYTLDCPPMGAKKSKETWAQYNARFDAQADAIANAIKECPGEWSGLIHVTRKTEAKLLTARLSKRGLSKRVWPFTGADERHYVPTDQQVLDWTIRKQQVPNSIGISWSTWEGFNGLDERICIVAKAPFPLWGSPGTYEEAWRRYSGRRYRWAAAVKLAQGCGRTRRGRAQDYDAPTEKRGFVAIADKSWTQCKKYLPKDILDSIREL